LSIDGVAASVVYKGIMKRLVYQFKYEPYVYRLDTVLGNLLYEGVIQNEIFSPLLHRKIIISYIPVSYKRMRKRGYDHAQKLAQKFSHISTTPLLPTLLRIKDTKPQFRLSRSERNMNIKNAFEIDKSVKSKIQGKTIVLIDDLVTSFATLRECAKVLKRNGAKTVWGAVLAREEWN